MQNLKACFVLGVLALIASHVKADVTCYSCNSATDSNCNDNFKGSPTSTQTCTGASCTKTSASVSIAGFSSSSIVRGCSPIASQNGCSGGGFAGVGGTVCYCSGNYCNEATRGTITKLAMLTFICLALFGSVFASRRV